MDGVDLLAIDLDTHWVADARHRLVRARTPEHRGAPLLVVGTAIDGSGVVWATSADVPDHVRDAVATALAEEATPGPEPAWQPAGADRLLAVLAPLGVGSVEAAPSYVLGAPPPRPAPSPGIDVRTSDDAAAEDVRALVPAPDRALAAPWAVALVDGVVASVCESARLGPSAAAAGVWTYEPHRRRGLASTVVGTWAGLLGGRTPLYGHDADNVASRQVARRVGFRRFGHWWQVRPAAARGT